MPTTFPLRSTEDNSLFINTHEVKKGETKMPKTLGELCAPCGGSDLPRASLSLGVSSSLCITAFPVAQSSVDHASWPKPCCPASLHRNLRKCLVICQLCPWSFLLPHLSFLCLKKYLFPFYQCSINKYSFLLKVPHIWWSLYLNWKFKKNTIFFYWKAHIKLSLKPGGIVFCSCF